MQIEYSGYTFPHAFRFHQKLSGKEIQFSIMVTSEIKNSVVRYVGVCLENGIESRSHEKDIYIAISAIICDIVGASMDIYDYYNKNKISGDKVEFAGSISSPEILTKFNNIEQEKTSSLAYYWELKKKVEYGVYFSQSRFKNLAISAGWLNFFSMVRMVLFNKPIQIADKKLSGRELMEKYKISRFITKIGDILSLSRLFDGSKWEQFSYALLY